MKRQQILTITVLFVFCSQILSYFPINIGPLTITMIFEITVFALLLPSLRNYMHNLGRRDNYLMIVCLCMLVLSYINLSGKMRYVMPGVIFSSMFAYYMIVCFFSGDPKYGIWLRRFHLIPAYAAIYSFFDATHGFFSEFDITQRIGGNDVPSYLMVILPICWTQLRRERSFFRFLNLFVVGCTGVILILTASRTAFVCLLAVSIVAIYIEKPEIKAKILIASLMALFAIYIIIPEESAFNLRIESIQNPISALEVDRLGLWKAGIQSIKENPLLGGDFRSDIHRLVTEFAPESNYARHIYYGMKTGNYGVHNGYLAVTIDFGVIVAILYFRFYFFLGRDVLIARRKIRDEANQRFLTAGIISLWAYAVLNLTLHAYIGLEFFIIWAVLQCSIKNALLEEK